jgi:DNA-binding NarL/FixJ family response regulator
MKAIKLAIADDHELFRKGLIAMLSQVPDFKFVVEASHGQDLLEKLVRNKPDLILMDLHMPVMDGMQASEIILNRYGDTKIIVLSMLEEDHFVLHMLEKGVHGYLLKDTNTDEVEKAIRRVLKDGHYYSDFVSKIMHRKMLNRNVVRGPLLVGSLQQTLTTREKEVLSLLCDGLSTTEISERLFISARTVEGHRQRILEKTNTKNTASAVAYAYRNNLL